MTHEESDIWKQKTIEATGYLEKLRRARQQKGWSERQAATAMGLPVEAYYDIELCEGDLTNTRSLNEILNICKALDIQPCDLFCSEVEGLLPNTISITEVANGIKRHCEANNIIVEKFEDIVGWNIQSCLTEPTVALDEWTVDCLMDVCREIEVDWRSVIFGL